MGRACCSGSCSARLWSQRRGELRWLRPPATKLGRRLICLSSLQEISRLSAAPRSRRHARAPSPRRGGCAAWCRKLTCKLSRRGRWTISSKLWWIGSHLESRVSRLCGEIDDESEGVPRPPLERDCPHLSIDPDTYVKVRQNGRIVSAAAIVALGVDHDGDVNSRNEYRCSEAQTFSTALCTLTRQGLRNIKLVVSDAHRGRLGSRRQGTQCQVAALRRARHGPGRAHADASGGGVSDFIATEFCAGRCRAGADAMAELPIGSAQASDFLDDAELDILACIAFLPQDLSQRRSTSHIDGLHVEIKPRTELVWHFLKRRCHRATDRRLLVLARGSHRIPMRFAPKRPARLMTRAVSSVQPSVWSFHVLKAPNIPRPIITHVGHFDLLMPLLGIERHR
ncbi:transposase [Bradyrhizobium sp. SZCCHNRI3037]|uniref:transposase n=1 Tax=Bradyrhizobium sp. SZCCHNRI3037 TaxID=3057290 RepID=UPI002916B394|nr:transposase [Bradyrhizobium sp. SZCCHNRI3037]